VSRSIVSGRVEKSLREIGLTEYESQAYLVLVSSGEITAGDISKNTSIPYSKVYSVLDSLERKGWIEVRGGRPRQYYPKAPVEAMNAERSRLEAKFDEHQQLIVGELQPAFEQRKIKEKPEIWIIRGAPNIVSNINEIVVRTKRELMVALPMIAPAMLSVFSTALRLLRDRQVNVRLLTARDSLPSIGEQAANIASIRVRDEMFGGGIVSDGRESLIFLGEGTGERQALAIWSDNVGLTMIAKVYFEHLWSTAQETKV